MTRSMGAAAIAAAALLVACGGGGGGSTPEPDNRPPPVPVRVTGVVFAEPAQGSGGGGASRAGNVRVTAASSAGSVSALTDAEGVYTISAAARPGDQLLVSFEKSGQARLTRTFRVNSGDRLTVSPTMRPLSGLQCDSIGGCRSDDGKLGIDNLEAGVTGQGRVFSPESEASAFPGSFSDAAGNLLSAGVFAAIELRDQTGQPFSQMPARLDLETMAVGVSSADLQLELPRATWPAVRDLSPGDADIDVSLYAFDETTGEWTLGASGVLVDQTGAALAEGALATIRDGSFAGPLFARAAVTHFSWWSVAWPVQGRGTVKGKLLAADGKPALGAVVNVALTGGWHFGLADPVTVGADGSFCVESLRSEAPGEDVDGDFDAGEVHTVAVTVAWADGLYTLDAQGMTTVASSCPGGAGGVVLDPVTLDTARRLQATLCTFTGVASKDGFGVDQATVWAWDDGLPWDLWQDLCDTDPVACAGWGFATTDPVGAYTLVVPMVGTASVFGSWWMDSPSMQAWRLGQTAVSLAAGACPGGRVDLDLAEGFEWQSISVNMDFGQIGWGGGPATMLWVQNLLTAEGKWGIEAAPGALGFQGPVIYPALPQDAVQVWPLDPSGDPAPAGTLAACDDVFVMTQAYSNGLYRFGTGDCVLVDPDGDGTLGCHAPDSPSVTAACGGGVDPGGVTTDLAGTWLGDWDVSGVVSGYSGYPTLFVSASSYDVDLDSDGAAEIFGTWSAAGDNVLLTDTAGAEMCSLGTATYQAWAEGPSFWFSPVMTDPCVGGVREQLFAAEIWSPAPQQPAAAGQVIGPPLRAKVRIPRITLRR